MIIISDTSLERLDKYLKSKVDYSREYITKLINEGYILVNGKEVKQNYKVKIGDEIEINEKVNNDNEITPKKQEFEIVYEDDDIMVINKPSGLTVHPGAGNKTDTLVNGLMFYDSENLSTDGGAERRGIVHRLDKDTSGLMLVAKTNKAHQILSDDFKNKRVEREYVALLVGCVSSNTAHIDAPIKRSKEDYKKMVVASGGKEARTNLKVIKRYNDYTLVSFILETGRTHQIRVHAKYIGHPVFNDPVYGKNVIGDFNQFLHSKRIKFTHPINKKVYEFTSNIPKEFQDYLDKIN